MELQKDNKAFVLWLTGLSGAGKSTLAEIVYARLVKMGKKIERLDGDSLRAVFPATGFSKQQRDEHIQRVGFLASRLEHHGIIVVASFISPYRGSRQFVRDLCKNFIEVHIKASFDECKRRDIKGLYKKALDGKITSFTGLDDPYEEPDKPELVIDTETMSIDQSAQRIMDYLTPYL